MVDLGIVKRALCLEGFDALASQRLMAPQPRVLRRPTDRPGEPQRAGVLLLLFPRADHLSLVLTRRTDTVDNHRGQISLPGGRQEPGESLEQTAVRETCEELGVYLDPTCVLGQLRPLYIPPTDFEIYPYVAYQPSAPAFVPAPAEVAELLYVPLDQLLEPSLHVEEEWDLRGFQVKVPYYALGPHKVWGATAMVLSELEQRLWAVLN